MKKNSIPYRIASALVENNIKHIFGIPGTHNIELYDAFREVQELATILITDEQSAGFIADGYFRSSGKLACLSLVPGAGLTHALSGIAEAYLDQIPMLVLACGIRGDSGRKFQLHDIDQLSVSRPVTKASIKITNWDKLEDTITKAVKLSLTVPYGPVVLEIPAEGLITKELENSPQEEIVIPEKKQINSQEIDHVIYEINKAQKIGLYIGNLMPYSSDNQKKIVDFAEMLDAKVWTTLSGKGIFPENHPNFIWNVPGFGSPKDLQKYCEEVDLWIALGAKFSEVGTASYGFIQKENAKLIHVDIDSTSLGANYKEDISINGCAYEFIDLVSSKLNRQKKNFEYLKFEHPINTNKSTDSIKPKDLFNAIQSVFPKETIYSFDSGNGLFNGMENLKLTSGQKFMGPVDYSCMGYCVPSSIGAQIANPNTPVIALPGDGAFLMTGLEVISTKVLERSPLVFVLKDGKLSQIEQFQKGSVVHTTLTELPPYDLEGHAKLFDAHFIKLENGSKINDKLKEAFNLWQERKRVLVEVPIDYSELTSFTKGVIKVNFKRYPTREKFYLAGRLITRKMGF